MLEEPENLSLSEMRTLEADYWGHTMYRWLGAYKLYEQELHEAEAWQDMTDADASFMFGNPYGRAWWDDTRTIEIIPKEIIEYVDSKLPEIPTNFTEEYFRRIQRASEKYKSVQ